MIRARKLLPFVLLAVLPATAAAQTDALRLIGPDDVATAQPIPGTVEPAYPADALAVLGARIEMGAADARVILFDDTLEFFPGSAFFVADSRVRQLAAPARAESGELYLPRQFFAEWLPERYPERIRIEGVELWIAGARPDAEDAGGAEGPDRAGAPAGDADAGDRADRDSAGADADTAGEEAAEPAPAVTPVEQRVVIIDPGHGGRDPGTLGAGGLREKDLALAVSRRVADALRSRGYEVRLTRDSDRLIPVGERPRLANEWKAGRPAALFVSIHMNAFPNNDGVRGFETFFLAQAQTEDERRVAEMENAAVLYEDNTDRAPDDALGHILTGLRNNYYVRASNDLAAEIQAALADVHPGPNRGVKQAGFFVLVGAAMPAVLVELGFITNSREAALLRSDDFQRRGAAAIAEAVERFFDTHEHLWAAEGT